MPSWSRIFRRRHWSTPFSFLTDNSAESIVGASLVLAGSGILSWTLASLLFRIGIGYSWTEILVFVISFLIGGICLTLGILKSWKQVRIFGKSSERLAQTSPLPLGLPLSENKSPMPTVPDRSDLTNSPGIRLAYRLPVRQDSIWPLLYVASGAIVSVCITTILGATILEVGSNWTALFALIVLFLFSAAGATFFSSWLVREISRNTLLAPTILEVARHPLVAGQPWSIYLSQVGNLELEKAEMRLVCIEEAVYNQGTDVRKETVVVHDFLLFAENSAPYKLDQDHPLQCLVHINCSDRLMHSFEAPNNRVVWFIQLELRGPRVQLKQEFPLVVWPATY